MRLSARYALVCLFLTSFCSVRWFFHEASSRDNDPSPRLFVYPGIADDRVPTSGAGDAPVASVSRIQPREATQLIRELGFDTELDFGGFDNETGAREFIVPNVIHYIRFKQARFSFVEYICMLSAYFEQRPDYIFIHTDVGTGFRGKYWRWVLREQDLASRIRLLPIEAPDEVFGQKLSSSWRLLHGSDLARIGTMMTYGGIYLDTDVYVVQSLDKYRRYELALGWPINSSMGTQVMIGHRKARFPPLWLETYREYHADDWYYNAGERPTKEVLERRPEIVHRVADKFGVQDLHYLLYRVDDCQWPDWRQMDTVHLLTNHRWYLDPNFDRYRTFNERNVLHYPYTFGEMARRVMARVGGPVPRGRLCLPPN